VAYIARELGVSRSWASREANSAGVRNYIAEAIIADPERVEELLRLSLEAVNEALRASGAPVQRSASDGRSRSQGAARGDHGIDPRHRGNSGVASDRRDR
jgi:hypothetical protein